MIITWARHGKKADTYRGVIYDGTERVFACWHSHADAFAAVSCARRLNPGVEEDVVQPSLATLLAITVPQLRPDPELENYILEMLTCATD